MQLGWNTPAEFVGNYLRRCSWVIIYDIYLKANEWIRAFYSGFWVLLE
jgi:hypothetical protein